MASVNLDKSPRDNEPPSKQIQEELIQDNYFPKFIGVLYSDVKREYFPSEEQYISEVGVIDEAKVIASYLEKMGIKAKIYPGNSELSRNLEEDKPDMVFNLVQSVRGREELEPTIPAMLELLEIPYTGTGMLGLSITHNLFELYRQYPLFYLPR
jgi:D-alanine-D-alanine ligase-like ATP-grasp enzyme